MLNSSDLGGSADYVDHGDTPGTITSHALVRGNTAGDQLEHSGITEDGTSMNMGTVNLIGTDNSWTIGSGITTGRPSQVFIGTGLTIASGTADVVSVSSGNIYCQYGSLYTGYAGGDLCNFGSHVGLLHPLRLSEYTDSGSESGVLNQAQDCVASLQSNSVSSGATKVACVSSWNPTSGATAGTIHAFRVRVPVSIATSRGAVVAEIRAEGYNCLATTGSSAVGFSLQNDIDATVGVQQNSGSSRLRARGWRTDSTAESQPVDFYQQVRPVQGAASPTGSWFLSSEINDTGFADLLSVSHDGVLQIQVAQDADSLPVAPSAGATAYFSNGDAGSACMAWYDGTNWRVMATTSDTVVSSS